MKCKLNRLYGKCITSLSQDELKQIYHYSSTYADTDSIHTKQHNCTITITMREQNHTSVMNYDFDDYRIAVAFDNILNNIRYVKPYRTKQGDKL